jgi:hypothetical protein
MDITSTTKETSIIDAAKELLGEQVYQSLFLKLSADFAKQYDKNQRYNGWTNYETWLVNLHLTNEGEELVELSRNIDTSKHTKNDYVYKLARYYKEHYNDLIHEIIEPMPYMIKDLTNASLQDVDWRSIAEHIAEDYYDPEDFASEGE